MSELILREGFWVRAANVEQDLVIVRDIFRDDAYRTALLDANAFNVVVDIGAHIGVFARLWHDKNPGAKIVCVEACPENIPALQKNVGHFARVIQAACTYQPGPLALLNAVRPNCESTGGSMVVPRNNLDRAVGQPGYRYWRDSRPVATITLEEIMDLMGVDCIELLKLDCEGSELDILDQTDLSRVRFVVGEYHDEVRWQQMVQSRLRHFDYGHMFACAGRGLFHLANKVWPPLPAGPGRTAVKKICLNEDRALLEMVGGYYDRLHDLAKSAGVKKAVEIGVRAGYGTAALLAGGVEQVIGIESDSDPASAGHYRHAQANLPGKNFTLQLADSRSLPQFPAADLIVVDGDHAFETVREDLQKAMQAAPLVICDDYYPGGGVQKAVDEVLAAQPGWTREDVDWNSRAWKAVLLRKQRKLLRVAVPSGIGDACWPLVKLASLLKREGADFAIIDAESSPLPRTKEFLEHFDFVKRSDYFSWRITEANPSVLPDGTYNYAPSQPRWHGEFDWMLQANGHLERGGKLADWLPDLEPDWDFANRFRFRPENLAAAEEFQREVGGPFLLLFAASESSNTTAGHNRGPLWTPGDWASLCWLLLAEGIRPVFIGATWDRSYYEKYLRPVMPAGVLERIGNWPIGTTFAVARDAVGLIAYQSGLGIFATYLGVPCAMWWRPDGNSLHPDRFISFREGMASNWAPPGAVESGRYLPLIYSRCSPEAIHAHVRDCWLANAGRSPRVGATPEQELFGLEMSLANAGFGGG